MRTECGDDLRDGEITLLGRVMPASNATFVGTVGEVQVVYKPVAGERPLWDFPDGTLAGREVAAYAVSEALGWGVVPTTILREGPHGTGMVQRWHGARRGRGGRRHRADRPRCRRASCTSSTRSAPDDEPVALVHEDSERLRRMAVFDVLVNNGDRKGGHVLATPDGHRYGVDHGVSFHVENKLRTVLWGWVGQDLLADERVAIERVRDDDDLHRRLGELVTPVEVLAFRRRCQRLLDRGVLPSPSSEWPAIPWPAF